MTTEEFKARWEKDDLGDGITYADIAQCAKEWGLNMYPTVSNMPSVVDVVLKHAKISPEHL